LIVIRSNLRSLHVKKRSTVFVIFIFIPKLLVLFFSLSDLPVVTITPDHQSIIVGNPVTLGCSVQANPMHTTVVWRKIVNGVATDLPANSRYSVSTV
jgi:hypothetical protein